MLPFKTCQLRDTGQYQVEEAAFMPLPRMMLAVPVLGPDQVTSGSAASHLLSQAPQPDPVQERTALLPLDLGLRMGATGTGEVGRSMRKRLYSHQKPCP